MLEEPRTYRGPTSPGQPVGALDVDQLAAICERLGIPLGRGVAGDLLLITPTPTREVVQ